MILLSNHYFQLSIQCMYLFLSILQIYDMKKCEGHLAKICIQGLFTKVAMLKQQNLRLRYESTTEKIQFSKIYNNHMSVQTNKNGEGSRVSEPQYQQDYQYQDPEADPQQKEQPHERLQVIIQQKQPTQNFISLKKEVHPYEDTTLLRSDKDDQQQKQKLVAKLKNILYAKIEQIKEVKKTIGNCKKQIKDIGDEVDKEMNKSILKHSKPHTNISIQQIFQQTRSTDPQINNLTGQLSKIRAQVKRVKGQLKSVQIQVMAPVNIINLERATQIKSKIKESEAQIKKLREQKQYLQAEMKMIEENQIGYQIGNEEQIKSNRDKNGEVMAELKEEKNKLYQLEKQDRVLTQKIRYIQQLEQLTQYKKSRSTVASILPKEQLQPTIKQLIQEIKQILQKRNKVENQRKNIYRSLQSETANMQAKNWEIINKLRQIDARLIKHYNSRLKKTKAKKQDTNQVTIFQQMVVQKQKNREKLDNSISTVKTTTIYGDRKNDKNIEIPKNLQPQPVILVQKRKTYDFFMNPSQNQDLGNVILSDQMLGNKLNIKRLNFFIDENILYGISVDYENQHKNQIHGYKIMSRIKPKDILTKTLLIDNNKNQVINFLHVGIDKGENIKFLHLITSQAKQFKWGNLDGCAKNQQKNLRKYENIVIKGKLNQIYDKQAPNYYCLGGLGLVIVYLGPK